MTFSLLFADDAVPAQPVWLNVLALVMMTSSACVWIIWQRCNARGRDLFGPRDVRSENVRPWGWVTLLGFMSMFVVSTLAVGLILHAKSTTGEPTQLEQLTQKLTEIQGTVLANVIILAMVLGFSFWQVWRSAGKQIPWRGLIPNGRDLRNGVLLGVACIPLLLMLQGLLQYISLQFVQEQTEHPYIALLRKNKDLERSLLYELMGWISVSVTVLAPILEEILFRGLLQGWLRGKYQGAPEEVMTAPAAEAVLVAGPESNNPYQASQVREPRAPAELRSQRLKTWAPIFITSLVFALFHYGHGPAVISLFFFSLALGYVYEKTGRLAPSIIAHLMLNLCTTIMLWATIMYRLPWD